MSSLIHYVSCGYDLISSARKLFKWQRICWRKILFRSYVRLRRLACLFLSESSLLLRVQGLGFLQTQNLILKPFEGRLGQNFFIQESLDQGLSLVVFQRFLQDRLVGELDFHSLEKDLLGRLLPFLHSHYFAQQLQVLIFLLLEIRG